MTSAGDVLYLVLIGEDIDDQRLLSLVNKLDGLIHTTHCDDGQQWPEDLLLHHFGFACNVLQHSGSCTQTTGSEGNDQYTAHTELWNRGFNPHVHDIRETQNTKMVPLYNQLA